MANEYNIRNDLFINGTIATGGETAPDAATGGITISIGELAYYALTFKTGGASHNLTAWAEADTRGMITVTPSGLDVSGYGTSVSPISLSGVTDVEETSDTGQAAVTSYANKLSAGSPVDFGDTANIFAFCNNGPSVCVVKGSGDIVTQAGISILDSARTDNGTIKYASNQFQFRQNGSWTTLTAGSVAGSDTQVQFNDGGAAFGAESTFTFDKTKEYLKIGTNNSFSQNAGTPYYHALTLSHALDTTNLAGLGVETTAGLARVHLYRASGTPASLTAVSDTDVLSTVSSYGHDGTEYEIGTAIQSIVDGTVSSNTMPTYMKFLTRESGTLTEKLRITKDGKLATGGETAPDVSAGGLCLNQGAEDESIVTCKSSDVSHPFTSLVEADTFLRIYKTEGAAGGADLWGFADSDASNANSMAIRGFSVTTDTSDTGFGCVLINGYKTDGSTGITTFSDTENLVSFRNYNVIKAVIKGDGSYVTQAGITAASTVKVDSSQTPFDGILQSNTATQKPMLYLRRSRTSLGQTLNNDHLGGIDIEARTSSSTWEAMWNIYAIATVDVTTSNQSSVLNFTGRHNSAWNTPLKLKSDGTVVSNTMYSGYTVGGTNKDVLVDSSGNIGVASSSERFKENITDMADTSWLYDLRPVNFNYKESLIAEKNIGEPLECDVNQYGLIAEEVELINKDFVSYDKEGRPDGITYSRLIPVLINEIQNLRSQIEILRQ